MESTRAQLRRRPDVAPEDVDDVVAIAAELQDAERDAAAAPTVAEMEAVARELDVDPKYVEQALAVHRQRRAEAAAATLASERERESRAAGARRLAQRAAAAIAVVALVAAGSGMVSALTASSRIAAAHAEVEQTAGGLAAVLDRQASLAPQLVALAGGQWTAPPAPPADAPIEARLTAADALGIELTRSLGSLPPATDAAAGQQRLNLQYELTGTQNRIAVERRRWEDARAAEQAADWGLGASLARAVGLAH